METTAIQKDQLLRHCRRHCVAVVAFGNALRGDDGVAAQLLSALPQELAGQLCVLDAGSYTLDVPAFLAGHQAGIILDAAELPDERLCVVPLSAPADLSSVRVDSCHAVSWWDELRLYRGQSPLPERLLFVGVPAHDVSWRQQLSERLTAQFPQLLTGLVELLERELACTKQQ